jgi:hypothetical protein
MLHIKAVKVIEFCTALKFFIDFDTLIRANLRTVLLVRCCYFRLSLLTDFLQVTLLLICQFEK